METFFVFLPWQPSFVKPFPSDVSCKLGHEFDFFFINMKYFEVQAHAGEWEEVERYLSGFTKVDDNCYSMKIFFKIRKQKY